MLKEIVKISRNQISNTKQFNIELDGTAGEIAEALFALVESNEPIRQSFGKLCERALINSLHEKLTSISI